MSAFLILPAGSALDTHAVWFRLLITSALNIFYRRGGAGPVSVLLLMSEFAQLGKMPPIRAAFGQARKYNLRCLPILQNWGQLVDLYGEKGAWTFIAGSDLVAGFNPGHDLDTAEFFSRLCGERLVISKSASPDLQTGVRENVSEGHDRVWAVDRVRQLPEFHGLVWQKNRPVQPVYFEPYMDNAAQRRAAREDPYYRGAGTTAGTASRGGGSCGISAGVAVSFAIVLLLALSLLGVL